MPQPQDTPSYDHLDGYTPTELQLMRREALLAARTPCELRFEAELIDRKIQYEPQSLAQGFFVDFRILPWKLAVEIDGWYHDLRRQRGNDLWRESILLRGGWSILRFRNKEVQKDVRSTADFVDKAVLLLLENPGRLVGRNLVQHRKQRGGA